MEIQNKTFYPCKYNGLNLNEKNHTKTIKTNNYDSVNFGSNKYNTVEKMTKKIIKTLQNHQAPQGEIKEAGKFLKHIQTRDSAENEKMWLEGYLEGARKITQAHADCTENIHTAEHPLYLMNRSCDSIINNIKEKRPRSAMASLEFFQRNLKNCEKYGESTKSVAPFYYLTQSMFKNEFPALIKTEKPSFFEGILTGIKEIFKTITE